MTMAQHLTDAHRKPQTTGLGARQPCIDNACQRTAKTCANVLKRKISGLTRSRWGEEFIAWG
jgi:hypothetical protein